ncbi:MAG: hypothetical protein ABSF64_06910 [Bryobacteraceae bacterium]
MKLNRLALNGIAALASFGVASAQDALPAAGKTYSFTLANSTGTPYCDTMSFTVTAAKLVTGTHGNAGCSGLTGVLTGASATIAIAPESPAMPSPAFLLTDSILPFLGTPLSFYVIDVKHLTWVSYADQDLGMAYYSGGILIPTAPAAAPNGLSPAAIPLGPVERYIRPETTNTYAFTFTGYCDGVSFTVTDMLLTGTHDAVNCGVGDGEIGGAVGKTTIAPETSASPAYFVADQLLFAYSGYGFYVIDVNHLTWAVYLDQGSGTAVVNQGTLTPGAPPAGSNGLPSTFRR